MDSIDANDISNGYATMNVIAKLSHSVVLNANAIYEVFDWALSA